MTLRLAVTPGEPAGIGPDLLIQLIQQGYPHELLAYSDPALLRKRAAVLGLPLRLREPSASAAPLAPGELAVVAMPLVGNCTAGTLNVANANFVLACLERAIADCQTGYCAALVTGPIHKGIINDAGIRFSGHTEFLAERTGAPRAVMMLATEGLRVVLATTHLPLAQVPVSITPQLLMEVIEILNADLQAKFAIAAPRILVCGLNPHAGEGGHLGHEERDIIEPTLMRLRAQGIDVVGPLSADTLFTPKYLAQADAVLAMYHDQGLPVLKYRGFGQAVNITLGLSIIRTSVDHGTALDLAGTGLADTGSFAAALDQAVRMGLARA